MTPRERSKALRQVREAWEDGKAIEYRYTDSEIWNRYPSDSPDFHNTALDWRVKAAPTYRKWLPHEIPVGATLRPKSASAFRTLILGVSRYGEIIRLACGSDKHPQEISREDAVICTAFEWKWPHEDDNAWRPCGVEEGK